MTGRELLRAIALRRSGYQDSKKKSRIVFLCYAIIVLFYNGFGWIRIGMNEIVFFPGHGCNPDLAQRKADKRKVEKKRKEVFTQAMKKRVKKLLRKDLSPEQIVGRSQVENIAMVSHETIYCWIWNDKRQGGDLHKYLRRQGRKYSKRGSKNAGRGFIPNRVDIDQRPSIVEQKERFLNDK